jgi:hypothetical protein
MHFWFIHHLKPDKEVIKNRFDFEGSVYIYSFLYGCHWNTTIGKYDMVISSGDFGPSIFAPALPFLYCYNLSISRIIPRNMFAVFLHFNETK